MPKTRPPKWTILTNDTLTVRLHGDPHTIPAGVYLQRPTDPRERDSGILYVAAVADSRRHLIATWDDTVMVDLNTAMLGELIANDTFAVHVGPETMQLIAEQVAAIADGWQLADVL
jgi:hypothetical protein